MDAPGADRRHASPTVHAMVFRSDNPSRDNAESWVYESPRWMQGTESP